MIDANKKQPSPAARPRLSALLRASVGLHAACAGAALLPGGWPWSVATIAANHALLTALGLWPRSSALGANIRRLPAQAGAALALTIDDGPWPEVTPAMLDLLDAHGAHATFFCIGNKVRQHARLAREIVRRGHHIENHSQHHWHRFSTLGPRGLRREIGDAQAAIADAVGRAPLFFRAPAGLRSPLLDPVLQRLGLRLVSWTRRGFDTRTADPARVLARLAGGGLRAGDILLLHDGHCARGADGRAVVLDVLPSLLDTAAARGLRTLRLADAFCDPSSGPAIAACDGDVADPAELPA